MKDFIFTNITIRGTSIIAEDLSNGFNEIPFTYTGGLPPVLFVSVANGNGQSQQFTFSIDNIFVGTIAVDFAKSKIEYVADYFPYGKILREFVESNEERFLTTQHERDTETGFDYRGARYYDSDVARFLSLDPHAQDYGSLSAYSYVAGNPMIFIDPDGKDIVVPDQADRARVQEALNEIAQGVFYIDKQGYVKLGQKLENGPEGFSDYYRDKLIAAINNTDYTITIDITNKFTFEGVEYSTSGALFGQAVTGGLENEDQNIWLSGNSTNLAKDTDGNTLVQTFAWILMHELVGHAIPHIEGSDTGNAVENENKVRREVGDVPIREAEPTHVE